MGVWRSNLLSVLIYEVFLRLRSTLHISWAFHCYTFPWVSVADKRLLKELKQGLASFLC